jgi:hypothetical protein
MSAARTRSPEELIEQRAAKLAELGRLGPLVQGSLTRREVRCGNASCRCARGERHVSYQLTRKVANRTRSVYVPVDMVDEVSRWVEQYRRAKGILKEITELSEELLRGHVAARRAGRGGSGRRRKSSRSDR